PNIFAGGNEFHSVREWISAQDLGLVAATVVELLGVWSEPKWAARASGGRARRRARHARGRLTSVAPEEPRAKLSCPSKARTDFVRLWTQPDSKHPAKRRCSPVGDRTGDRTGRKRMVRNSQIWRVHRSV